MYRPKSGSTSYWAVYSGPSRRCFPSTDRAFCQPFRDRRGSADRGEPITRVQVVARSLRREAEEGLGTTMLARLSLNLGPGVFSGPSLPSAASLSQLVGLLFLGLGLLSLDPTRDAWEPAVIQRK